MEAKAQQLMSSELVDVRAAAANWRTGLLAMLGVVTTVMVVKGRDSFKDLDLLPQALIGAFLLLALLLASIGSVKAMKAAFGDPRPRKVDRSILVWERLDAVATVNNLKWARSLFFGALAAVVIAVALTWYWPAAAAAKVRADNNGVKVCGTLKRADSQQVVITEDGSDKTIPTANLRSMTVVTGCPQS